MTVTTSGAILEHDIEELLKTKLNMKSFEHSYLQHIQHFPCIVKNIPYVSIMDRFTTRKSTSKTEFGIYTSKDKCLIRIECKFQNVIGSVSEKFLGLFIQATLWPEQNIFFYCDGKELKNPKNKYMIGFSALLSNDEKVKDIKPHTKNMKLFIDDKETFIEEVHKLLIGEVI